MADAGIPCGVCIIRYTHGDGHSFGLYLHPTAVPIPASVLPRFYSYKSCPAMVLRVLPPILYPFPLPLVWGGEGLWCDWGSVLGQTRAGGRGYGGAGQDMGLANYRVSWHDT